MNFIYSILYLLHLEEMVVVAEVEERFWIKFL